MLAVYTQLEGVGLEEPTGVLGWIEPEPLEVMYVVVHPLWSSEPGRLNGVASANCESRIAS